MCQQLATRANVAACSASRASMSRALWQRLAPTAGRRERKVPDADGALSRVIALADC
jgi:hypothetical protein